MSKAKERGQILLLSDAEEHYPTADAYLRIIYSDEKSLE